MKYIYKYLVLGMVLTTFCACEKELGALPKNDKVDANTILDQGTAQTALNGAYYYFANAVMAKTRWQAHQVAPAELAGYMGYGYGAFGAEWSNKNTSIQSYYWEESYKLINAVNGVATGVNKLPDNKFTGTRKKEIIAEARFLRAYGHFKILTFYGEWYKADSRYGVLLRDELSTISNIAKPRSTVKDSYDFILADLDDAIANGPEEKSGVYATKWAAMALKARVLMSRGKAADYTTLIGLADEIIDEGPFTLESNARDIFQKNGLNSSEVILGLKPQAGQELDYNAKSWQYWPGHSSLYVATPMLKVLYDNDPRQAWVIGPKRGTTSVSYFLTKYMFVGGVPTLVSETDYALRLTEVYLLKAEAIVRSGGSLATAKTVIHEVQEKAGITNVVNSIPYNAVEGANTPSDLLMEIYKETVKSLIAEDGMEWMALLRLPFATVKQLKPTIISEQLYILPIPKDAFLYNPLFGDQNPGYIKN
ncbi:RagB/SusD family nutrient uptake outer membrane protein [Pedobacter hiemivivus]|uniref:RagB/SusD family nutrient uptake outer membrane protein n=1 Tax=Pedobacter hiemivivus TaxID=2530454 RepID=A0A4U1GBF0_9SPHI|nr:RagB/SusD family nutrient uptake outer membrane protein [Pedobacter hiemivivus]TKC60043.1 RagB/SusD family nutrient uptake outer membrane protein [Pedobacter hiemivivus]